MKIFNRKEEEDKSIPFLDGYVEGPFAHGEYATSTQRENEYFMQRVLPRKLHRIALRTPVGYRITYGLAEDVWNNRLGIKVPYDKELAENINKQLTDYLKSRNFFEEMEKLTGAALEQGEAILLLYTEDIETLDDFNMPVSDTMEILEVEAINKLHYDIRHRADDGTPQKYGVDIKIKNGIQTIPVDATRVLRFTDKDLQERGFGYPKLAVAYDAIVILSNIIKATGEGAYRWGTGHPLILTKDITDDTQLDKLKDSIGTPTRRSWHILPSEYIDRFDLIGEAGQMLNFRALADIVIDQIVIATKIPRPILTSQVTGVTKGSEVNERSFFAVLDEHHTNLEPFVRKFFARDINIVKMLNGLEYWELDWGIREVMSKLDQITLRQKEISTALALTSIATVNEVRHELGYPPIPDLRGEVVLGVGFPPDAYPADEANNAKEEARGAEKSAARDKDLEKDKTIQNAAVKMRENKASLKDSFAEIRKKYSLNELADMFSMSKTTLRKFEKIIEENEL